jgi:hypothetical protein
LLLSFCQSAPVLSFSALKNLGRWAGAHSVWVHRCRWPQLFFFRSRPILNRQKLNVVLPWLAPFQHSLPHAVLPKAPFTTWIDPSPGSHSIRLVRTKIIFDIFQSVSLVSRPILLARAGCR